MHYPILADINCLGYWFTTGCEIGVTHNRQAMSLSRCDENVQREWLKRHKSRGIHLSGCSSKPLLRNRCTGECSRCENHQLCPGENWVELLESEGTAIDFATKDRRGRAGCGCWWDRFVISWEHIEKEPLQLGIDQVILAGIERIKRKRKTKKKKKKKQLSYSRFVHMSAFLCFGIFFA